MGGKKLNRHTLEREDILLNLREINIGPIDSYSSSTCAGSAFFYFENETKHGYIEDPDLTGTIKVLDVQKKGGCYLLKIKLKRKSRFLD